MKNKSWFIILALVIMIAAYYIGEATGLLFFSMLIILPIWAWLLTEPDKGK